MFPRLYLCPIRLNVNLFDQEHLTERPLSKLHDGYKVDGPNLLVLLARPGPPASPLKHVIVLPYLNELLLPLLPTSFFLLLLSLLIFFRLATAGVSGLFLLELHSFDDALDPSVLLAQVHVHVLVGVHEALDRVDAVVVSQHSVHGRAPVALAHGLLHHVPRDKGVKELPNFHVLSDVGGRVAELVLDRGVCLRLLDQVDDALEVAILTCIVQGSIHIEILGITVDFWLTFALNEYADNVCVSTHSC